MRAPERRTARNAGRVVARQTVDQIVDRILELPEGTRLAYSGASGARAQRRIQERSSRTRAKKVSRARASTARFITLDETDDIKLERYEKQDIEIVVDRIVAQRERAHAYRRFGSDDFEDGRRHCDGRDSHARRRPRARRSGFDVSPSISPAPTTAFRSRNWSRAPSRSTRPTAPAPNVRGWVFIRNSTHNWWCPTRAWRSITALWRRGVAATRIIRNR